MKNKKLPKPLKIAGIIILSIILLVLAVFLYLNEQTDDIAENYLKSRFAKSSLSQAYRLEYSDIDIHLLTGDLIIKNVGLRPDSAIFSAPDSVRKNFPLLIDAMIPRIIIRGFDPEIGLEIERIKLESLKIKNPEIILIDYLSETEKKRLERLQVSEKQSVQDTAGSNLKQIDFGTLALLDGSFRFHEFDKLKPKLLVEKINLTFDSISFDPKHPEKTMFEKKFHNGIIELNNLKYPFPDGFYIIELANFSWDPVKEIILLNNLKLIPQYLPREFGKKFGRQTDRMDLKTREIQIHQPDLEKFVHSKAININLIRIQHANLWIFRDKNVPLDTTRYPKLPHQAIGNLDTYLNIPKVELVNSEVLYEELAPGAEKAGVVPIEKFYGSIYNVTNDKNLINRKGPMKWDLQGVFFEGDLNVTVDFPANLNKSYFTFKGQMGAMDMTNFNSITVQNEKVKIEKGNIVSMEFTAEAFEDFSEGEMTMIYDNLKLSLLKDKDEKGLDKMGLISGLANVVIKSSNLKDNGNKPEASEIFFERDKNKSIFNYMAKSLIAGIKSTIIPAFNMTREKYEKKQKREERREERRKRREERRNGRGK